MAIAMKKRKESQSRMIKRNKEEKQDSHIDWVIALKKEKKKRKERVGRKRGGNRGRSRRKR